MLLHGCCLSIQDLIHQKVAAHIDLQPRPEGQALVDSHHLRRILQGIFATTGTPASLAQVLPPLTECVMPEALVLLYGPVRHTAGCCLLV